MTRAGVIEGDGVGPEIVAAARMVVDATGAGVEWVPLPAGADAFRTLGSALPAATVAAVRELKVVLKGPMAVPVDGYPSPNQGLRAAAGAFVNIRSVQHYPHTGRYPGLDLVIARDVTEDLTRGIGHEFGDGLAGVALRITSRESVERLARFAYTWAQDHGLERVTIGHLAPSQRTTDGIFLRAALDVAREFPTLTVDDEAIDPLCTHLLQDPTPYQLLLTPNLYGGILCGVLSGLAGSVGLMPGVNVGDGIAIFEPGHGTAPKYAGTGRADPIACILSGAMLLEHVGHAGAAQRIHHAVREVIGAGLATPDIGGTATTSELAGHICDRVLDSGG